VSSEFFERLRQRAVEIHVEDHLRSRLERGDKLRVKLGLDPTAPDLHVGHLVVLDALRAFQDDGHVVVLIVGDYTALIGDPSGRSETRPVLSREQIDANAKTYFDQIYLVLDRKRTEVHSNSEWLGAMGAADVLRLMGKATLQQVLQREDFAERLKAGTPIGAHEILYPFNQAYDSVAIKADVEIGGTDQLFNNLMGRTLQEQENQEGQVVLTLPLLEGLDGVQKMSKSLGNYVGIDDAPDEMFGKLMSISDELMWRYIELLSFESLATVSGWKASIERGSNPRDVKVRFAQEIVARFHDRTAAQAALEEFESRFRHGGVPDDLVEQFIDAPAEGLAIAQVLKLSGVCPSASEALRMIEQRGVRVDGETVTDKGLRLLAGSTHVLQVGKRKFARVTFRKPAP